VDVSSLSKPAEKEMFTVLSLWQHLRRFDENWQTLFQAVRDSMVMEQRIFYNCRWHFNRVLQFALFHLLTWIRSKV